MLPKQMAKEIVEKILENLNDRSGVNLDFDDETQEEMVMELEEIAKGVIQKGLTKK